MYANDYLYNMAEDLVIDLSLSKEEKYKTLLPQIEALIAGETNIIANMGNLCAAIKETFNFLWVGFYLVENDELVLGPFQGPVACTRIYKGKGVCGTSWEKEQPIIVPNVEEFPGHIACSSLSKSEIVLPVFNNGNIIGVFDVDDTQLNTFNEVDKQYLTQILSFLSFE